MISYYLATYEIDLHVLRLLSSPTRQEIVVSLTLDWVLVVEILNILHQPLVFVTLLPSGSEFLRSSGDLALEPVSGCSLTGRSKGCKEIRSSLLFGAVESHVEEVLLGIGSLSEVDLFSFVEDCDFVEEIVCRSGRLVDGDNGGSAHVFCSHLQVLDEFDGVGGIETSGRVIPTL